MSSQSPLGSNQSIKRQLTEILTFDESQTDSFQSPSPKKKRKLSDQQIATPIFTPSPTKQHHHNKHNNYNKIPIIHCNSGHGMVQTQNKTLIETIIECASCHRKIKKNEDYFHCPKNNESDSLCSECFDKEKTDYTGAIALGQTVQIKTEKGRKLGKLLLHWPDGMYTIQIEGETRNEAQAYDIYEACWDISLVHKNQFKPTPTRILTQCDTDTDSTQKRRVPRCETGCPMKRMDARNVYNADDNKESESDNFNGIYCNKCCQHIESEEVYHCGNKSHDEGYDLCLSCSQKASNYKTAPILQSYDLKGLAHFISSQKCNKIGILCGAGISRNAGIPDFRSKDGIYRTLKKDLAKNALKYGLTLAQKTKIEVDAQYVFSVELFRDNPTVLYKVLAPILTKRCKPTLTHCFFKLLQNKGKLSYIFSQNVDGLERYIGIDPNVLSEVHGTFLSASCIECGADYDIAQLRQDVVDSDGPIQCKNKCKGYVKPNCVLFGEDLPRKYYEKMENFEKNKVEIDLLLVIGTSLSVEPVSNLPNQINSNAIRCLMNLELNGAMNKIFKFNLKNVENKRDIFIQGKCDESVQELCKLLKWENELAQINENSNKLAQIN